MQFKFLLPHLAKTIRPYFVAKKNAFEMLEKCSIPLEDLLKEPVLTNEAENSMTYEQRMEMKDFKLPADTYDIEQSFRSEFNESIKATNWKKYEPLNAAINAAGKLAYEKLLHHKVTTGQIMTLEEIEKECDLLYNEIQTGDYSRWMPEVTSDELANMDDSLQKIYKLAKLAIDSNPDIHPDIKRHYLSIIASYLKK